jgi:hypothetical protein
VQPCWVPFFASPASAAAGGDPEGDWVAIRRHEDCGARYCEQKPERRRQVVRRDENGDGFAVSCCVASLGLIGWLLRRGPYKATQPWGRLGRWAEACPAQTPQTRINLDFERARVSHRPIGSGDQGKGQAPKKTTISRKNKTMRTTRKSRGLRAAMQTYWDLPLGQVRREWVTEGVMPRCPGHVGLCMAIRRLFGRSCHQYG